jgi:hypothetical protein
MGPAKFDSPPISPSPVEGVGDRMDIPSIYRLILCSIIGRRINPSLCAGGLCKEVEGNSFKGERIWVRSHKIMG